MDTDNQERVSPDFSALSRTISPERLGTYLTAAGHDRERALALYVWNARLGEAFHTPIQAVEVGLRNNVGLALIEQFGAEWWRDDGFPRLLDNIDGRRLADLEQVRRRLKKRGMTIVTGQVVAGLSFGFWVALLQKRYNPVLWSRHLSTAFPHLPLDRSRADLADRARKVADLRNRITHHEPIFRNDISKDFSEMMMLLEWMCPETHRWIRPHCRVPDVMRRKP
jgi:hypothetical protein